MGLIALGLKIKKQAYKVREVAALTGFSRTTVTRMFRNEPGVILMGRARSDKRRGYQSLRIPRAVYERVVSRLKVK